MMRNLEEINEALQSKLADAYTELNEKNKRIVELEEQLAPYIEEEKEKNEREAKIQRYRDIVSWVFPKFDWTKEENKRPARHPFKCNWWDGGSLDQEDEPYGLCISVSSYVGGGNVEQYYFEIPSYDWLTCADDDLKGIVQSWCIREKEALDQRTKQKELERAERDAVAAVERLAKLKGGS